MAGLVVFVQQGRRTHPHRLPLAAARPARVRRFGTSGRWVSVGDMAADIAAFFDALSIERATIVGHSFGSFVARRMAIDYPARVQRLILVGTGWLGSNDVLREVHASLRDLTDPVSPDFARDFQASTTFSPVPEPFFDQIVRENLKLPSRLWAELLGSVIRYDDRSEVGRISAPTLLLWGDHDALFSRDDQLARRRRNPSFYPADLSGHRPLSKLGMPGRCCGRRSDVSSPGEPRGTEPLVGCAAASLR